MAENTENNLWLSTDLTDKKEESPNQLQSLLDISESSVKSSDYPVNDRSEIERIVQKTLKQMQSTRLSENIDTLMSLIVPRVIADLRSIDQLHEEVQSIRQSLNSYMHHSKSVDEDVAEIFLDLHNIYKKIENIAKVEPKKEDDKKFHKRLQEAQNFLKSNQHFILNSQCQIGTTVPIPCDVESNKPAEGPTPSPSTREVEKEAFLTNMLMVKKSDYSFKLNRNKNYFGVAERFLKNCEHESG